MSVKHTVWQVYLNPDTYESEGCTVQARVNDERVLNTTVIMHNLIIDVCNNSSPDNGICLSERYLNQLDEVKKFNYANIYKHKRFEPYKKYSELVITQIFDFLLDTFDGSHSWVSLDANEKACPFLIKSFKNWLAKYCDSSIVPAGELKEISLKCENSKIYGRLDDKNIYIKAIIDYISGMTDSFAIKAFNELLTY